MSRRELAEAVNRWLWRTTGQRHDLDGHAIARYERGAIRWPGAAYRCALRAVLNVATDAELGFAPSRPALSAAPPSPSDLRRPTLNEGVELEGLIMDAADESSNLLARTEASNVGEMTLEQLHSDLHRITNNYLKVPTPPLFTRTRALRDRAFALLDGRQRPRQARDLYSVAGWSLTVLAWMTVDLGRPDVAETHARTAWACAENADNDGLRAWVLATQHTAAFWQNDYERAAERAAAGLKYATGSARLFLASAYALDLARLGRAEQARDALTLAYRRAEDLSNDELRGPFTCDAARAGGFWSDTMMALGDAEHTARHADEAVKCFEALPNTRRNHGSERMVRIQQAKARLVLGQLDGVVEAVAPVLTTEPEHRVRPLLRSLSEVQTAMNDAHVDEPIALALGEGINEFVRRPVVTELGD